MKNPISRGRPIWKSAWARLVHVSVHINYSTPIGVTPFLLLVQYFNLFQLPPKLLNFLQTHHLQSRELPSILETLLEKNKWGHWYVSINALVYFKDLPEWSILRQINLFVQVNVLYEIQQFDTIIHGALKCFSTHYKACASSSLVDDSCASSIG